MGHYVSLMAEGPGDPVWYSIFGSWDSNEGLKQVFSGVQVATHTPIPRLPFGYRLSLVCVHVETPNQVVENDSWCR